MRAENARLGVETTMRSDLTARSAIKPRSRWSNDQRQPARPDRRHAGKMPAGSSRRLPTPTASRRGSSRSWKMPHAPLALSFPSSGWQGRMISRARSMRQRNLARWRSTFWRRRCCSARARRSFRKSRRCACLPSMAGDHRRRRSHRLRATYHPNLWRDPVAAARRTAARHQAC